jgi:hypothetical protein
VIEYRMPGLGEVHVAGPEQGPPDRPEEIVVGLLRDDQFGVFHHVGEFGALDDESVIRFLEIAGWRDSFLQVFLESIGYCEQVECVWPSDAVKLAQDLARIVHVLKHLGAQHTRSKAIR